jgi:choline dehydrogenase
MEGMQGHFSSEEAHQIAINESVSATDFAGRVRHNQEKLRAELMSNYDFIVCGSGSAGSVVARRLAENTEVSVLLLEAGGDDDVPAVMRADQWPTNLGSERDWNFMSNPSPHVNFRQIALSMGKVLGGGSSVNVMTWARGHKSDWDFFASESGDSAWSYESVLDLYRRIEDWHGAPDPDYRGTGGPVFVQPPPEPNPIAQTTIEAAREIGIATFENQNGRMMEAAGGASFVDSRIRAGTRQSIFRSYVFPYMDRPNLTVLRGALVTRVNFYDRRAVGVTFQHGGTLHSIKAASEVVLSLGAIHTPKVLMQSGIGNQSELRALGIYVVQHLPGVGKNYQDHPAFGCVWEYQQPLDPRNALGEMTFYWRSNVEQDTPDLLVCQLEVPFASAESVGKKAMPEAGWTLMGGVSRPKSRGAIRLTGPRPTNPVMIDANMLQHPDDVNAAMACVDICREIGNSARLRPFVKREVIPGRRLRGSELTEFVRNAAVSYWHQSCTAKMGTDNMSVVDSRLKVHGIVGLRIADASIMPRVTTGNTMAPCVVIGERAAEALRADHGL